MSLVFAGIVPHPPLLIPNIGRDTASKAEKTKDGLKKLEEDLYISKPELILVITPHCDIFPDSFSTNIAHEYETSLKDFGDRTEKVVELADAHIVFKGGTGTMAELALVWEKAKFEFGNHEPLIFYGDCWKNTVEDLVNNLNFDSLERKVYAFANSPEEVLDIINNKKSKNKPTESGLFSKIGKIFANL